MNFPCKAPVSLFLFPSFDFPFCGLRVIHNLLFHRHHLYLLLHNIINLLNHSFLLLYHIFFHLHNFLLLLIRISSFFLLPFFLLFLISPTNYFFHLHFNPYLLLNLPLFIPFSILSSWFIFYSSYHFYYHHLHQLASSLSPLHSLLAPPSTPSSSPISIPLPQHHTDISAPTSKLTWYFILVRYVTTVAKIPYWLRHVRLFVCPSAWISAAPAGPIFAQFYKGYFRENTKWKIPNLFKIGQKK